MAPATGQIRPGIESHSFDNHVNGGNLNDDYASDDNTYITCTAAEHYDAHDRTVTAPGDPDHPRPTVPTNTPEIADLRQELQGAETGLSEDSFRLQQDNQTLSSDIQDCSQGRSQGVQSPIACSDEARRQLAVSVDSSRVQNDESEIQNYNVKTRSSGRLRNSGATYDRCRSARHALSPSRIPGRSRPMSTTRSGARIVACRSLLS